MALVCAATLLAAFTASAQRQMEMLGRGVVAVRTGTSSAYVGWRLLGSDPDTTGFNLYRVTTGVTNKLNGALLTNTTDFVDGSVNYTGTNFYFVEPVVNGATQAVSTAFALPAGVPTQQFLNIPLTPPPGGTSPDAADGTGAGGPYTYNANDCSVGDVDGDGEYEIIVKWDPSNSKDNSQSGYTGNTYLDCYKLNGTRLWRINLGPNIRSGAHYMDFMVFDFDGDGKAEVMCRTAPGALDSGSNYVGGVAKWQTANGAHPAFNDTDDYRNTGPNGNNGYVLAGPEFLSVFNGLTGEEMATTTFYPKRDQDNNDDNPTAARINTVWGDGYGNRLDRFLAGVAYVDGQRPSGIFCRGYYTRAFVTAWDWRNGTLTKRWVFDSNTGPASNLNYRGQGAHSLSIGDADGDGKDEIIYGAASIDDNGQGLYSTALGHGDAEHFSDMDPWRPGKEIWMVHEDPGSYGPNGLEYRDAKTGALIFGVDGQGADVGRGCAYDIDPRYRGYEMWGARGGLMSATGVQISSTHPSQENFCVWWDADLLRETLDGTTIYKWNWLTSVNSSILAPGGIASNNSTKATPNLSADIFGDWREEVIWRTSDNLNLRIYTTTTPATNHLYTLMHDPQYRCAIAWQNTGYNQPPHPGFFIGQDMFTPPLAPISSAKLLWRGGSTNTWDIASTANWTTNNAWTNANPATTYNDGDSVLFDLTGSNNSAITLPAPLAPGDVTVYSYKNYSFAGEALTGAMKLVKAGNATLTLNNTNSYTGQTMVSDGALRVNGILTASPVLARWPGIVGGAGTLGGGLTLQRGGGVEPGASAASAGTLTISNALVEAGENINYFNLSDDPSGAIKTNDFIQVFGNVSLSGLNSVQVTLLNGQPGFGAYGLIAYSGSLGGGVSNLNVSGLEGEYFFLTNSPGLISLVLPSYRSPTNLLWVGGGANNWDMGAAANWSDGAGAQQFFPDDAVRFDNTGSTSPSVNVIGSLRPGAIVVDATNNYTLGGGGAFVGTGGLFKTNSGTLTINTTASTFKGRTILGGGMVVVSTTANGGSPSPLGAANNSPTNLVFSSGATLRYTGVTASTDHGMTFNTGGGTLDINSSAADFTLTGTLTGGGSLTKTGAGSLSISAANNYSGGTVVRQGTLSLGAAVANTSGLGSGSVTLTNSALLDFFASGSGDTSAGGPFNNALIIPTNTSATLYLPFRITINSALTGGGTFNLRVNGSRDELYGNWSAFTGQINVTATSGGDFRCNNSAGYPLAKLNLGSSCTLQNRVSGTPTISIGELSGSSSSAIVATGGSNGLGVNWNVGGLNTSATFAGGISNNVSITKVGTGTLTLSGTASHSGQTTINGGTLLITGDYSAAAGAVTVGASGTLAGTGSLGGATTVNGTLAPGSATLGTLTFGNNLTLNPGSTTFMEIRKSPLGNDLADAAGTLAYNGALAVTNLAGTLTNGDSFKIFNATAYGGSFNSFNLPALATNLSWITSNLTVNGTLSISGTVVTNPPSTNQSLIWKGDGAANAWDTATTLNWLDASNNAVVFNTNDAVSFTDTGSNNVAVALVGTLRPAALTVDITKNYTFGGTGLITGTNALVKSGSGTLTLTNSGNNSFAGGVIINGGILALGTDSGKNQKDLALGTGPVTVGTGAQLRLGGDSGNTQVQHFITNAITLDGGTLFAVDGDQHFTNSTFNVAAGGGTLLTRWANKDLLIESRLTGGGALTVNYGGAGGNGSLVYFSNPLNTYSGTLTVLTNAIALTSPYALSNAVVNVAGTGTSANLTWSGITSIVLGGLSGAGNIALGANQLTVGQNGSSTIFSGALSGPGALVKNGTGTFTLSGPNTYTGATSVSNGTLLVHGNNLPASGAVTVVNGATLGGNGSLGGATTIQSGGRLSPGASIGAITFSNTLSLGGTTFMEISRAPLTNDVLNKTGTLIYGGALVVTNLAGTLAAGDSFKLFNAANYSGAFAGFVLPALTGNLVWNTNLLKTSGTLSVAAYVPPVIGTLAINGTSLNLAGSGGIAGWTYYVLASTNLAESWTPVATNQFDAGGNFIFTNVMTPNSSQTFFKLQLQ